MWLKCFHCTFGFCCLLLCVCVYGVLACEPPSEPQLLPNEDFVNCSSVEGCSNGFECKHLWLGRQVCCTTVTAVLKKPPLTPLLKWLRKSKEKKLQSDSRLSVLSQTFQEGTFQQRILPPSREPLAVIKGRTDRPFRLFAPQTYKPRGTTTSTPIISTVYHTIKASESSTTSPVTGSPQWDATTQSSKQKRSSRIRLHQIRPPAGPYAPRPTIAPAPPVGPYGARTGVTPQPPPRMQMHTFIVTQSLIPIEATTLPYKHTYVHRQFGYAPIYTPPPIRDHYPAGRLLTAYGFYSPRG